MSQRQPGVSSSSQGEAERGHLPGSATPKHRRLVADAAGARLDVFLARRLGRDGDLSRAEAQRLIEEGNVLVDGSPSRASHRLRPGEVVDVTVPPPRPIASLRAQAIPIGIVYQDSDLIIVDKPAGLTVHPAPGHPEGTLVNALLALFPDLPGIGGEVRPGIVHRLDKDTSGLMVVARTERAHHGLIEQFQAKAVALARSAAPPSDSPPVRSREKQGGVASPSPLRGKPGSSARTSETGPAACPGVQKTYLAIVRGDLRQAEGVVDAPIGRHPVHRKKMAVLESGRPAVTRFRVLRRLGASPAGVATLVEATPETGRTHQVRVHLASLGHPLLGDGLYGKPSPLIARHALHASRLAFRHPVSGRWLSFESPLPPDMAEAVAALAATGDRAP